MAFEVLEEQEYKRVLFPTFLLLFGFGGMRVGHMLPASPSMCTEGFCSLKQ